MLKNWSVENFKTLANTHSVLLAPMTVLVDEQEQGPTGLLQSIAMLAQTLSVHGFQHALVTNGPFVQAGSFAEVVGSGTARLLRVRFELDCQRDEDEQDVIDLYRSAHYSLDVTFGQYQERKTRGKVMQEVEQVVIEALSLAFRFEFDIPAPELFIEGDEGSQGGSVISEGLLQLEKITARDEQELQKRLQDYPQLRVHHHRHSLFLGTLTYGPSAQKVPGMEESPPSEQFFVGLSGFLPRDLVRKSRGKIIGLRASRHVSLLRGTLNLEKASEQITDYFSNRIYYLSGRRLNVESDTAHFTPTSKLDEVGARGEFAIGVYHANQQTQVYYRDPQSGEQVQRTLQEALDSWLHYLGIAEQVSTRESGRNKLSWRMVRKTGQKPLALPAGNSDFSQVIPLLLLGLLAPEGSLLLIEHPEEHLSQEVQVRLLDFLNSLGHAGKQCIVETASETLRQGLMRSDLVGQRTCYAVRRDSKGTTRLVASVVDVPVSSS